MSINVCIVEPQGHPAPGALERLLPPLGDFTIRTTNTVPEVLTGIEALILNSIPSAADSIPEERVLRFVHDGGGLFCIHDTIFPSGHLPHLLVVCGKQINDYPARRGHA